VLFVSRDTQRTIKMSSPTQDFKRIKSHDKIFWHEIHLKKSTKIIALDLNFISNSGIFIAITKIDNIKMALFANYIYN